jgi:hypothetical protein
MHPEGGSSQGGDGSPDQMSRYINALAASFRGEAVQLSEHNAALPEANEETLFQAQYGQLQALAWELRTTAAGGGIRTLDEVLHELSSYNEIIRQGLHDPRHARQALDLLEGIVMPHHPYDASEETKVRFYAAGLMNIDTDDELDSHLKVLAATGSRDMRERATDLLFTLYPYCKLQPPAHLTSFLARAYAPLVERHRTTAKNNAFVVESALQLLHHMSETDYMVFAKRTFGAQDRTHPDSGSRNDTILGRLCGVISRSRHLTHSVLERFGLDGYALRSEWYAGSRGLRESGMGETQESYRRRNIATILLLEGDHPGTCTQLQDTLNIRHFVRYPRGMLHQARRAIDNPPPHYALYAVADWDDQAAFDGVDHVLDIKVAFPNLIPVEVGSIQDIRRIRRTLRQKGWPKADHLIAVAHGSAGGLTLSATEKVNTEMVKDERLRGLPGLLRHIIDPAGTIVLDSCSTGKTDEQSFAAALRTGTQFRVLAPTRKTSIRYIQQVTNPVTGRYEPRVMYWHGQTKEFLPEPEAV